MEVDEKFIDLTLEVTKDSQNKIEHHSVKRFDKLLMSRTYASLAFHTHKGKLALDYTRVQQNVQFELLPNTFFQVGFLGFVQKKNNLSELVPSLNFKWPNFYLEFVFGRYLKGIGLVRRFSDHFSLGLFWGQCQGLEYFEISTEYRVNKNLKFWVKSDVFGNKSSCGIRLEKGKNKASLYIRSALFESFLGVKEKRKIGDSKIIACIEVNKENPTEVRRGRFGVEISIGKYLKFGNYLEESDKTYWVFALKGPGIHLEIPLKVRLPVLVCCFGVCFCSYVCKKLYNYLKTEDSQEQNKEKYKALEFTKMVEEKVRKCMAEEDQKNGLVVVLGLYGEEGEVRRQLTGAYSESVIDVTVPLNFMVEDSKLAIPEQNKEDLQGFYKISDSSILYIKYKLRGSVYEISIKNDERLLIN